MNVGMLWLDSNTQNDLSQRIQSAVSYYRNKYGKSPNLCFLHPQMADASCPKHVGAVEVRTSSAILPNHFWLGIEEDDRKEVVQAAA